MADPDDREQVNGEIAVIAAQMAGLRELIEQMRSDGKSTAATELALQALSELYRQRLRVRQGFDPVQNRRPSSVRAIEVSPPRSIEILGCT